MRRFRYKDQRQQFPIAAHIHDYRELSYLRRRFFHDLAKGMGGDHSTMGIGIAKSFVNVTAWARGKPTSCAGWSSIIS